MENNIKVIPSDFHWKIYLKLNKDLPSNYSKNDCINHYLNFGKYEKRLYKKVLLPIDFDWRLYLFLNEDLLINNKRDSILHYLKFGKNENRKYKITTEELKKIDLFYYGLLIEENNKVTTFDNSPLNNNLHNKSKILDNNNYDYLDCNFLIYTRVLKNELKDVRFLQYSTDNNILDTLKNFILIIDFQNGGGGTTFFLNSIISKYKNYQTFVIARNFDGLLHLNINEEYDLLNKYDNNESLNFLNLYKNKINKIFINHTIGHNEQFLNKLFTLKKETITITHDYSLITKISQPYYHQIKNLIVTKPALIDYNSYDIIISQNEINMNIFNNINYIVDLPDFKYSDEIMFNNNSEIVIGIIGNIINLKGRKILKKILNFYKNYTNIQIVVIGNTNIKNFNSYHCYNNINEFNYVLKKFKPNALLELSLWPETYSYTLTLSMLTKLPIFVLKKKFISVIENRLKNYDNVFYFSNLNELEQLVNSKIQKFFYTIKPYIYYNKFWNDLFITNKSIVNLTKPIKIKHNISPYLIFFPQFHTFKENNINFYENFTDILNLKKYNLLNTSKLDEPLLTYLSVDKIEEYNLENINVMQKQINLLELYGYEGFAVYYYWFSHNNLTNQHMIMEKVINNFFNNSLNLKNKKIFFIWANENWTNNDAFGNNHNNMIIKNSYNKTFFYKNAENLLQYFKHNNYLKIDNKPVFFIYHSHLITIELLDTFYSILNNMCIKNNFSGVHFVLNSFVYEFEKYPNFYINFNYKKKHARFYDEEKKQLFLDYKEYIDNYKVSNNTIQTIVFDFNNKPRLFEPNHLDKSTVCIKNTEFNKILFAKKIIDSYSNKNSNSLENILLINSFNEWGESMAVEPSCKYEYYYLNLLKNCLENK
jgi:hypothetical protein